MVALRHINGGTASLGKLQSVALRDIESLQEFRIIEEGAEAADIAGQHSHQRQTAHRRRMFRRLDERLTGKKLLHTRRKFGLLTDDGIGRLEEVAEIGESDENQRRNAEEEGGESRRRRGHCEDRISWMEDVFGL